MKTVLVLLAPGFEEIETITVVDILRRAGARVTLAGTQEGPLEGSRGISVLPDEQLDKVLKIDFDLIVLPGGQPGTNNLKDDPRVLQLLKKMDGLKKNIAAICAAPLVLNKAGILKDRCVTSHPSVQKDMQGIQYSEDRVVVDGHIITSKSPGTAMEFSLKLVEILFGRERRDVVNQGVLAKI
ncbi:MAG: DJ-1 family protein [Nitrospinae bacterium CG22_combo_CG10-13_8_21_14_all_47_10]|nr:MAG: DJ-1 family protein [Nitrospinae bacterium CG22_combo_CG10-13_8_21_14_all_47_10]